MAINLERNVLDKISRHDRKPLRHVDKLTITGPRTRSNHNHSFFTREGRNEVHWSQDGFVLSQCSRRSHPVVSDDTEENELQVVEDICETPPPSNDDDQELNSIHSRIFTK